jgi:anti-sigma regulatory factor (Ser/Thr protein kinase)
MDWFFDAHDTSALGALREEFGGYLRRHADPDADVAAAELAFTELVSNAMRHAPGPAWVHLDWSARQPVVEVHDLGPGFELDPSLPDDPLAQRGRGLFIVSHLTQELGVAAKRAGGARVRAVLAVTRPVERSIDPAPPAMRSLPTAEEAGPAGEFGKEAFLRALVVETARAVEAEQGPDAAETVVAQVGAGVGGRMEDEYRRARDITGRLTPAQIADLYVRLKAAIDGDFYVIEVTDERIVLGNRVCPFGAMVTRAPGLCRMTSSVFGGIAARNTGGATVVLEERIAVGDPGCRVVVMLGRDGGEDDPALGHAYARREA